MKKFLCICMCFLSLFLFCSCNKADELGKNSIISVIYADFKNKSYVFTSETSDFSGDNNSPETSLSTGQGNTPGIAWENLKSKFQNTPYFGHAKAIILGKGFYTENIEEVLRFLISENSVSPNAAVYITSCNPYDFKSLSISEMARNKTLPSIEMYTFFSPSNYCSDIPVLKCKNEAPYCNSTALFKNFSYESELDKNNFFIYSLIKNRNYQSTFKTFELTSSKANAKVKNKELALDLNLFARSIVPVSSQSAEVIFKNELEGFISYLLENKMTYILTNEEFTDYKYNIRLSLKENSKLKGNMQ